MSKSFADFAVELAGGKQIQLRDYAGNILLVAFLKRADCACEYLAHILERLLSEYGHLGFQPIGCLIDLLPGEPVPEFRFKYPIGARPRRVVSELLNIPMSGFHIPQILFMDRYGRKSGLYSPPDEFCKAVDVNARMMVERLVAQTREDVIDQGNGCIDSIQEY
jgi:hypothetical protein